MRRPWVAGSFYPSTPEAIKEALRAFEERRGRECVELPRDVVGVIVPHAGWAYSGFCASCAYAALRDSFGDGTCFVLIGPNHTGLGAPVAMSASNWQTPLGIAKYSNVVAKEVAKASKLVQFDEGAHVGEHCLEVQLPFLQYLWKDFEFVAITLLRQDLEAASDLGFAIAKVAKRRRLAIIASSDFTHYEPRQIAREKDALAFEAIAALNEREFLQRVEGRRISICGPGAIAAAIVAAKLIGAKGCRLIYQDDSGAATGESSVVDYIAAAFTL